MLLRRGVSFGAGAEQAPDGADLSSQPAKWALRVVPPMPASIKCRCGEVTVTFAEAAPRQSLLCCCVDYITSEFHASLAPFGFEGRQAAQYPDEASALQGQAMLMAMVADQARSCRAKRLTTTDDESYPSDRDEQQLNDPRSERSSASARRRSRGAHGEQDTEESFRLIA